MTDQRYRVEHDTMGEVRVPAEALWRAQTQRAGGDFPISRRGPERAQSRAFGLGKAACARGNGRRGGAGPGIGGGIVLNGEIVHGASDAAGEIGHLPVDPRGRLCGCGRTGCWETVVGLRALLDPDSLPVVAALAGGHHLDEIEYVTDLIVPTEPPQPRFGEDQRVVLP